MDTHIGRNADLLLEKPLPEIIAQANEARRKYIGTDLELCSIINAKSGLCTEDCKFCAQSSRHSCKVDVYPLRTKAEIVEAAESAAGIGAGKFGIVTSGNRPEKEELKVIAEAVSEINKRGKILSCASLGALSRDELSLLKEAGLFRYHHNIETSPRFYSQIVTTHNFKERIETIKAAKEVGLEVCSGGIIGMGESWEDRIDMANILKELNVDSVPINLLVPVKGTAMDKMEPISCKDAIRSICIFRIILKDKVIKIAAGRETVLKDFQGMGFMAGANGMLIGGYLTVRGRPVDVDRELIKEIRKLWQE